MTTGTKVLVGIGAALVLLMAFIVGGAMGWVARDTVGELEALENAARRGTSASPGEDRLDTRAYLDRSDCPKISPQVYVGVWEGESTADSGGERTRWTNTRNADGTFSIEFVGGEGARRWTSVEHGYWAIYGCLYTTVTTEVDGEPALYQEVYRVHPIDPDRFGYSNYGSGESYEQKRVRSSPGDTNES
jgi:hypothetical protein